MPHGIYVADHAASMLACAGQKWRPSNGTEGELFIGSWCAECSRDATGGCSILSATFAHEVTDEAYPPEWQIGGDGQPRCSAWLALDDPPKERCEQTADMFAEGSGQ
ncbi:hypothetical protein [Coralloluteibacterium thermophilus]|uniref:Uncharacterized protein n=1 Tax=Coralloluteibacterium thermophilum TaxID=2707049 RepID=A0ABV9NH44_9GAMM